MQNLDEEFCKRVKDIALDIVIDFKECTISTILNSKPLLIKFTKIVTVFHR